MASIKNVVRLLKGHFYQITYLALDALTTDPTSPPDGSLWYRSDTDLFKARANGATVSLVDSATAATTDALAVHLAGTETIAGVKNFAAGTLKADNDSTTNAHTFVSSASAARNVTLPDATFTVAKAAVASGTPSATSAPAFTGTTPTAAFNPTALFSGTGQSSSGQVITTTDNQTMTLNQCAGMLFISATHGPYYIASNTAVSGAAAVLTIYGTAPTTDAGTYKIINGLAPVGTVAAVPTATHTHTQS